MRWKKSKRLLGAFKAESEAEKRICDNCLHYHFATKSTGQCRYNAPAGKNKWPATRPTDYCSKFSGRAQSAYASATILLCGSDLG